MKRHIPVVGLALFSLTSICIGGGTSEGMVFTDIARLPRDLIQDRAATLPKRALGSDYSEVNRVLMGSPRSPNTFARRGRVNIDPRDLRLHLSDAEGQVAVGPPVFSLDIAGRDLELAVVDYVYDPSARLWHLAAILAQEDGEARFTVAEDENVVVGTIRVENSIYRIRQAAGSDSQFVFDVLSGDVGKYEVLRTEDGISDIEKRHVQMAFVADVQPNFFNTSDSGLVVHVSDAALGHVDLSSFLGSSAGRGSREDLASKVSDFLGRLSPLTQHSDSVSVEIRNASDPSQLDPESWIHVEFRQLLDGTPVASTGYLSIVRDTGEVKSFNGIIFGVSDIADANAPRLSERDALLLALDEIAASTGRVDPTPTVLQARLEYVPVSDTEIRATWQFHIGIEAASYFVSVDAVSGDTAFRGSGNIAAKRATCTGGTSASTTCSTPVYVESSSGNPLCHPSAPSCPDTRHRNVWDKMKEIEEFLNDNSSGYCCATIGLPNGSYPNQIKVIIDSDFDPAAEGVEPSTIAFYKTAEKTIVLPPPGTHGLSSGVDPTAVGTQEVLSHEAMHVFQAHANSTAIGESHAIPESVTGGSPISVLYSPTALWMAIGL